MLGKSRTLAEQEKGPQSPLTTLRASDLLLSPLACRRQGQCHHMGIPAAPHGARSQNRCSVNICAMNR